MSCFNSIYNFDGELETLDKSTQNLGTLPVLTQGVTRTSNSNLSDPERLPNVALYKF